MIRSSVRCEQPGCKNWAEPHSRTCLEHRLEKERKKNLKNSRWRGNSVERGYDHKWNKLSAYYRSLHPLCEHCMKQEKITDATMVDHKVPVVVAPERRLDESNLQSLCWQCHHIKTKEDMVKYPQYAAQIQQKDVVRSAINPNINNRETR